MTGTYHKSEATPGINSLSKRVTGSSFSRCRKYAIGPSQDGRSRAVAAGKWVADGTVAKIKCVMSALFSHAVRWESCGHNPISSDISVGSGGRKDQVREYASVPGAKSCR